jgi:hypothetical protein
MHESNVYESKQHMGVQANENTHALFLQAHSILKNQASLVK